MHANPFHEPFFHYDKQLVIKIALNTHAYESFSLVHWSVTDLQDCILIWNTAKTNLVHNDMRTVSITTFVDEVFEGLEYFCR